MKLGQMYDYMIDQDINVNCNKNTGFSTQGKVRNSIPRDLCHINLYDTRPNI